ncbi:MAG: 2-C-methyl-D-erythritol 4-phosphate cytidylyltransferase [Muribaculaceae bacterium]|nr:2-C-methyl-D-erythritol 4-phosphate cytidylyltransferase [Muribaculaceae bacterium]
MKNAAIIVAGGKGVRAGGGLPKQFIELADAPMIFHTLRAFRDFDRNMKIVVVMNKEYRGMYESMLKDMRDPIDQLIVDGGATRAESVKAGLECLMKNSDIDASDMKVAIHDAARPLISPEVIRRGMESVRSGVGAVPVVAIVSSLRQLTGSDGDCFEERASRSVDRSNYVEVQTPQIFILSDIMNAYRKMDDPRNFTDDASIAEAAGLGIALYKGDPANLKVTNPMDFAVAEALISGIRHLSKE